MSLDESMKVEKPRFAFDWVLIAGMLLVAFIGFYAGEIAGTLGASRAVRWQWRHMYASPAFKISIFLMFVAVLRLGDLCIRRSPTTSPCVSRVPLKFGYLVAVIVVFLHVVHMVLFGGGGESSPVGWTAGDIGAFNSALALYQVDTDSQFPKSTLMQLVSDNAPGWAGPYMATIASDPWNNAYTYTSNGTDYTIKSVHDSDYNRSETIRYVFSTGVMESLP